MQYHLTGLHKYIRCNNTNGMFCFRKSYTMDVYFRQIWYDSRLQYQLPGLHEFSMSWLFLDKVWKPDTYFMNGKKSHLHRITTPNKFLRLRQDGYIVYSMRSCIDNNLFSQ